MKMLSSLPSTRLAPGALPHDVLNGIISHVVQVATKKNLVHFIKFASDLFQIEVSHLYTPATIEFMLILHVPMVSNANLLNLYEFLPLPIHFNFTANISITPDVRPTNLLTIGHSQSFQTISSSDLHTCLHLRHFLLQREEGDGNEFEKILLRHTLCGQLPLDSEQLPFQNC